MNLHKRPLFILTLAYTLGVIFASLTHIHPVITLVSIIIISVIVFTASSCKLVIIVIALMFLAAFMRTIIYQQIPQGDISGFAAGKNVYLTGIVASDPEPVLGHLRFKLRSSGIRTYTGEYAASGSVMVILYKSSYHTDKESLFPAYGELVQIHGRLKIPNPPSNPGQYDYRKYLSRQRIFCMLTSSYDDLVILKPSSHGIKRMTSDLRSSLTSKSLMLFDPVQAMLLLGILLGNYASLPYDVQNAFMRSGTMHLLAASGYNCGILILIFGTVMKRLTMHKSVMNLILIALIWIFALVAGFGPSIVRASLMISLILSAYMLRKVIDLSNVVFASALVIMIANPLSIFDIGFQLSFAAVLSIILIMPLVDRYILFIQPAVKVSGRREKYLHLSIKMIIQAIMLSVASVAGTWPITASYFNYVSLVSIISNLSTVLLILPITIGGIISLTAAYISPTAGHFFGMITELIVNLMLAIVTLMGNLRWSSISIPSPSSWLILLYYISLLAVLEYAYRKTDNAKSIPDHN
ncbi:MAG: ComEC/Rec2 family competence protein [Armatimonadota bacterium]